MQEKAHYAVSLRQRQCCGGAQSQILIPARLHAGGVEVVNFVRTSCDWDLPFRAGVIPGSRIDSCGGRSESP